MTHGREYDRVDREPVAGRVEDVVESVRGLGERARLLAVNLAVAAARLHQSYDRRHMNDELLDLVAKVTRVSQAVGDAVLAIESGAASTKGSLGISSQTLQGVGIPDQDTLDRLAQALGESVALAGQIARRLREVELEHQPSPQSTSSSLRNWDDPFRP
ncbi:MAG TPA: hypothetical protein VGB22_05430 [candidate division Zixibacteria bacterium]